MTHAEFNSRIEHVTRHLLEEFGGSHGNETVRRCVAEARARFSDATVEAYVPFFVARHVRRLLGTVSNAT